MMDFAQPQALWNAVGHDLIGARQHIDIEFLFIRTVGPTAITVTPGFSHAAAPTARGWRYGDYHVSSVHRLPHRFRYREIVRRMSRRLVR